MATAPAAMLSPPVAKAPAIAARPADAASALYAPIRT